MAKNVTMLINGIFSHGIMNYYFLNEFKTNMYNLGCPLWIIMACDTHYKFNMK
jgi:hypothetical protein